MSFPTIFDWLDRLEFLRGMPAVYLVLLTAVVVVLAWDWRLAVLALTLQYLAAGLLFADVLDPRLMMVKVLVGLFVCLIFYVTARQVNWGRPPVDMTAAEAARFKPEPKIRVGPLLLPANLPLRVGLVFVATALLFVLAQRPAFQLPGVTDATGHLTLAVYLLGGLGLLGMALTTEPLRAGLGMMTFLTGFELFYSGLEQSLALLMLLAVANLAVALTVARLVQVRHSVAALLEQV